MVIKFFVGVISDYKHVHVNIKIIVKSDITLDTESIGIFIERMANSAFPSNVRVNLFLFEPFVELPMVSCSILTEIR